MQKANPKAVGGFVLGAIILAVAAVAIFGTGEFFKERKEFVVFFTGSYSGLRVGSSVTFRGVPIGKVVDFWVDINPDTLEDTLPVICDIEIEKIRGIEPSKDASEAASRSAVMIQKGLRAQLVQDSFVTGQQSVALDFLPDTPVVMVETDLPYPQIPTVPSTFEQVERDIKDVVQGASEVLERVNELLNEENRAAVQDILANVANLVVELTEASVDVRTITGDLAVITGQLTRTDKGLGALVERGNETLDTYRSLGRNADGILVENRAAVKEIVDGMRETEIQVSALADRIDEILAENQPGLKDFTNEGLYEITNLAIDLQGAVEQLRRVLEELESDPARFLLGEPGQREIK